MKRKVNEKWQMKKKAKESESERDNAAQALRINVRGQHSTATPIQAQLTDLAKRKASQAASQLESLAFGSHAVTRCIYFHFIAIEFAVVIPLSFLLLLLFLRATKCVCFMQLFVAANWRY